MESHGIYRLSLSISAAACHTPLHVRTCPRSFLLPSRGTVLILVLRGVPALWLCRLTTIGYLLKQILIAAAWPAPPFNCSGRKPFLSAFMESGRTDPLLQASWILAAGLLIQLAQGRITRKSQLLLCMRGRMERITVWEKGSRPFICLSLHKETINLWVFDKTKQYRIRGM